MSGSEDPLAVDEGATAQVLAVVTERHLPTAVKSGCGREVVSAGVVLALWVRHCALLFTV